MGEAELDFLGVVSEVPAFAIAAMVSTEAVVVDAFEGYDGGGPVFVADFPGA